MIYPQYSGALLGDLLGVFFFFNFFFFFFLRAFCASRFVLIRNIARTPST